MYVLALWTVEMQRITSLQWSTLKLVSFLNRVCKRRCDETKRVMELINSVATSPQAQAQAQAQAMDPSGRISQIDADAAYNSDQPAISQVIPRAIPRQEERK
jgi:hypothetical protein